MALTTIPASLSATAITLTTAAQPNITSVGTLTGLTVSGNIAGTLTTAAQPNITSVGTLTSLTVSGNVTIGDSSTAATFRAHYSDGSYTDLHGYGLSMNRVDSYIRPSTDGNKRLYIGGADASLDWLGIYFRSTNGLYMTGTQFIDTNRNLVNIGTISSSSTISATTSVTTADFRYSGAA